MSLILVLGAKGLVGQETVHELLFQILMNVRRIMTEPML